MRAYRHLHPTLPYLEIFGRPDAGLVPKLASAQPAAAEQTRRGTPQERWRVLHHVTISPGRIGATTQASPD